MKPSDLNRMYSAADRLFSAANWLEGIKPNRLTTEDEHNEIMKIKDEIENLELRLRKLVKKWIK